MCPTFKTRFLTDTKNCRGVYIWAAFDFLTRDAPHRFTKSMIFYLTKQYILQVYIVLDCVVAIKSYLLVPPKVLYLQRNFFFQYFFPHLETLWYPLILNYIHAWKYVKKILQKVTQELKFYSKDLQNDSCSIIKIFDAVTYLQTEGQSDWKYWQRSWYFIHIEWKNKSFSY